MGACAQIGLAKRIVYSGTLPRPPQPAASLDPTSAAYRAQADLVLAYSANLTDVDKLQVRNSNIPYLLAQPAHAAALLACSCNRVGMPPPAATLAGIHPITCSARHWHRVVVMCKPVSLLLQSTGGACHWRVSSKCAPVMSCASTLVHLQLCAALCVAYFYKAYVQ